MDWFREVNSYCERTDAAYWSEPVNALTNLAFVITGLWAWRFAGRVADRDGQSLAGILVVIGIGSWLFHTHAQVWAMMADVLPILVFILAYIFLATVRFLALPFWAGGMMVLLYFPFSILVVRGLTPIVGTLNGSMSYVPVPILIVLYAVVLVRRKPETARGLVIGAGVLGVSLFFRTMDRAVCGVIPFGTHFIWHLLNSGMLAWMIRVMVRDREAEKLTVDLRDM